MVEKINDGLTAKQRHAKKKFDSAKEIECACGCGEKLKAFDKYARPATFINGHNTRVKRDGTNLTDWEREKRWRDKNPEKLRELKNRFRLRRKKFAISLKGGKCVFCGVEHDGKNYAIFDFHHLDPEFKEENISKMLGNRSKEALVKELERCVLACANCHRLEHNQGE